MKKNYFKNTLLFLFTSGICFGFLEIFTRTIIPHQFWRTVDVSKDFWDLNKDMGWKNKNNLNIEFGNTNGELILLRTNSDGIYPHDARRIKSLSKEKLRIALIGDSTVMGRSVNEGKRLADILENELNTNSDTLKFEVISFAVEGHNIEQVYAQYNYFEKDYKPDIILYGICHNDWDDIGKGYVNNFPKPYIYLDEENKIQLEKANLKKEQLKNNTISYTPSLIRRLVNSSAVYRIIRLYGPLHAKKIGINFEKKRESYLPISRKLDQKETFIVRAILNELSSRNDQRFFFYVFPDVFESELSIVKTYNNGNYDNYQFRRRLREIIKGTKAEDKYLEVINDFVKIKGEQITHLLPYDFHLNTMGFQILAEILANEILIKEL